MAKKQKVRIIYKTKKMFLGLFGLVMLLTPIITVIQGDSQAFAAACATPSPSYGTDTLTVNVPASDTYTVWTRILVPTTTNNSVLLQIDSTSCSNVGGSSSIPVNSWSWVNYQNGNAGSVISSTLAAGNHTLTFIGNQAGVGVDLVMLIPGNSCIPSGTGTNCATATQAPTPVTVTPNTSTSNSTSNKSGTTNNKVLPAPAGTQAITENASVQYDSPTTISPTYEAGQTIKEVKYYLNKKVVYIATKYPFTYLLNTNKLLSGKYTLASYTEYISGHSSTASETVIVKHSFIKNIEIFLSKYWIYIVVLLILIGLLIWQIIVRVIKPNNKNKHDKTTKPDNGNIITVSPGS